MEIGDNSKSQYRLEQATVNLKIILLIVIIIVIRVVITKRMIVSIKK